MLLGPMFVRGTAGSVQTGIFEGKMILVASLWDREALPWQADWYRQRAAEHFGSAADDHIRLYYIDHALHGDRTEVEDPTHVVPYLGALHQGLRYLSAWVEKGTPPPVSTRYVIEDGQVIIPATAAERMGIQPVVTLKANGAKRADVAVGEAVTFTGTIMAPPGGGTVTEARWDFDGGGTFPQPSTISGSEGSVTVKATHRFDKPGTYFPVLLGTAQSRATLGTPYARLQNLDRVRVVVE